MARAGPAGASLREVARAAECSHPLIARHFGSKDGMLTAVSDRLARRVARAVDEAEAAADDTLLALMSTGRRHRSCTRLLVRSALGDLQPAGFPACLRAEWMLAATRARAGRRRGRRAGLCAYAASSLLLGWLTFEEFLVAATGLGPVPPRRRDEAIAAATRQLMGLAGAVEPRLRTRDLTTCGRATLRPVEAPAPGARDRLLASAIELFTQRGPSSVSVRDVAHHAGVNQGLIYRHFGSKEALLAEAIERGSSDLFPAALAPEGFDFDAMSHLMHHGSPAPRLVARTLVDDMDITTVRPQFTVLRQLLDTYDDVPDGPGPADLSDPRVAVTTAAGMALGSVIWGPHLRAPLGLPDDPGIESAMADLARWVISSSAPAPAGRRADG